MVFGFVVNVNVNLYKEYGLYFIMVIGKIGYRICKDYLFENLRYLVYGLEFIIMNY